MLLLIPQIKHWLFLAQMYSEGLFIVPHDWTAQVMSSRNVVYTYELHHRGEYSVVNGYLNNGLDLPQALKCKSFLLFLHFSQLD